MSSVKIILRTQQLNKMGEATLYLRTIQNRITKFISLRETIKPSDWDEKNGKVRKTHPNSNRMNAYLAAKYAEAYEIVLETATKKHYLTRHELKAAVLGTYPTDFFEYADKWLSLINKSGKIGRYAAVNAVLNKLKEYQKNRKLYIHDITVSYLKTYEEYLISTHGNSVNTISANFKIIRKVINDAINEDLLPMERNPFLKLKLKSEEAKIEFLYEDELNKIENLSLDFDKKMNLHRDMFVFACYAAGTRISDVLQLRWKYFDGERLDFIIQKTKKRHSVKLPEKAIEIILKYKKDDSLPEDFIFPILNKSINYNDPNILDKAISSATAYANKDLIAIAKKTKISKHISFHVSRHTFATLALRKGFGIEYVSKALGHSNIRQTLVYAEIVNADLDKKMELFNTN